MTTHAGRLLWPSAPPPPATPLVRWQLTGIADLPRIRAELRRHPATAASPGPLSTDAHDELLLAVDEMASNALRHGDGRVLVEIGRSDEGFLVTVCDQAPEAPPTPAVGRDPSEGGLGLYLIAEMAQAQGWCARDGVKHVWAVLPAS